MARMYPRMGGVCFCFRGEGSLALGGRGDLGGCLMLSVLLEQVRHSTQSVFRVSFSRKIAIHCAF